jgi:hypothetical protein
MEYKVSVRWCPNPQAYASWLHHSDNGGGDEPENEIRDKTEDNRKAPEDERAGSHRTQQKWTLSLKPRVESDAELTTIPICFYTE